MSPKTLSGRLAVLFLFVLASCTASQETAVVTTRPDQPTEPVEEEVAEVLPTPTPYDTVTAGRFDMGKMWTFDNPPLDYFEEAYGFRPDEAWFEKARLGALRFATYCSASFVSPNGLVMTNHHCGRQSVTKVSQPGEDLLDNGFYAPSVDAERAVEDLFVDQLIEIRDVTEEVYAGVDEDASDDAQVQARQQNVEALEERLTGEAEARDSTLHVQVIELYNGGQYSAYTFKRYEDVRLVMAPELQIGFFGGDPDNFTFPRYNLDVSFFRVYGDDGEPLQTANFFPWSTTGVGVGEAVFVVGSPGSTSRLSTVGQLEFFRDYALPQQLEILESRAGILDDYIEVNPALADTFDLRNTYFSLSNSIKSTAGQLAGLVDPYLIARRGAAERALREAIAEDAERQEAFGDVLDEIAGLQGSKEAMAEQAGAFTGFGSENLDSHILIRALYGWIYSILERRGAPAEQLEEIRASSLEAEVWPAELEEAMLAARLGELQQYLGEDDPTVQRVLGGESPEAVAERIVEGTVLNDTTAYKNLLDEGYLGSGDPTVPIIEAIAPLYFSLSQQLQGFEAREQNLNARLARARFAVYGTTVPPDATFSLRIADGVVRGYPYNGTRAPAFTTYFGLYNHYYSYTERRADEDAGEPWELPERWLTPPPTFDHQTPFNLVSTNDITGGNSGSPLLNRNLEVVGLIFDSNIEALPNEFLYTDVSARAISVDARGILEALDDIYDADRVVYELTSGTLVETEAEADAAMSE